MCLIMYYVLIFCLIILETSALNCRSEGGPKEAELKNIYRKCLKVQDSKNYSRYNSDQDWKESRGQIQKNNWDRGRMGNRDNRNSRDDKMNGRDRDDMMGRRDDRMSASDRMGGRNKMGGGNNRNNMGRERDERYGRDDYFNGREDFTQSGEYGSDMPQFNNYYSTQAPRRYKRERRPENSGQRSQYNPNTHKITGYEDSFRSDEKNSSENNSSKEMDNKACALHCFMENLEMVQDGKNYSRYNSDQDWKESRAQIQKNNWDRGRMGNRDNSNSRDDRMNSRDRDDMLSWEDGMPDRYLVTHAITKDVKSDDLRDFLQESIEECFQILDNENTEDKCEFSKNLLMCLSEKGRANCDDWKDDLKF